MEGIASYTKLQNCREIPMSSIFDIADELEIDVPDLTTLIEALNHSGTKSHHETGKHPLLLEITVA